MKKDLTLKAYLAKFGKTKSDIKKLSEPLREAWYAEYREWLRGEQLKMSYKELTEEECERIECYELLAATGVPFDSDGEPLGIG